jgi:alpha-N-arabinofuranosidase
MLLSLATAPLVLLALAQTDSPLLNGNFENDDPLHGWELVVYGAKPEVGADAEVKHEGRQSLRISASHPSDSALGQEMRLEPSKQYRFQGWVRTRDLVPDSGGASATYQIQRPGGGGVLASGPSHSGDIDWTPISIVFRAPPDGRVRVAAFLVGYGKGTGTAWFDAMTLDPIDPARLPVVVTREPLCPGSINPAQYGQFVEYLCDLVPSMWADKLADGNFEGLSPYKFVYLKETDFREHPWYPTGATNRGRFELDSETKVNGATSYRITTDDIPCTVGIAQGGIAVQKGVACEFSAYFKQNGLRGPVAIRLRDEEKILAEAEMPAGEDWGRRRVLLEPANSSDRATLTITFRGPGRLWIDAASLKPEDAVDGWRRDVVEAVRALKPAVIRFGGSVLDDPNLGDFEWTDTVGDPARRKPFRAWGGLQPTGPGLEEFIRFCRMVDAEPLICVRSTRRTAEQAAEQVEYFNGDRSTRMGALRARNGHPEPFRVLYWQVGNEQGGSDYEQRLPDFCRAMKAVDPSISLLSSYPSAGVIRRAGEWIDFVAPHHYGCENLTAMQSDLDKIRTLLNRHAPGRKIRVAVTEWNTTAGDAGPRRAMLWTLSNALACARYHNLLHRNADLVQIANRSNLINSFCSGCIQVDNHRLYGTPTYYLQKLYASVAGTQPLKIDSDIPPTDCPDLSATRTADGTHVVLLAVNDTPDVVTRPIDLSAFGPLGETVEVWTLGDSRDAGEPDVTNSFLDPERITARASTFTIDSPRFDYPFPALSVTALRVTLTAKTSEVKP